MSDYILVHHGIKGMHWGVRRFQNPDGSLTEAGRRKYGKRITSKLNKEMKKEADRKAQMLVEQKEFERYKSKGYAQSNPRAYSLSKKNHEKSIARLQARQQTGEEQVRALLKEAGDLDLKLAATYVVRRGNAVRTDGIYEKVYSVPVESWLYEVR